MIYYICSIIYQAENYAYVIYHKVLDESGIDFSVVKPKFKYFDRFNSTQDSVYYRWPRNAQSKSELISEWENMFGHQLQALPPFEEFWEVYNLN